MLSRGVIMVISGSDRSHASGRGGEGEVRGGWGEFGEARKTDPAMNRVEFCWLFLSLKI